MQEKDMRRRWPWLTLCGFVLVSGCHSIPFGAALESPAAKTDERVVESRPMQPAALPLITPVQHTEPANAPPSAEDSVMGAAQRPGEGKPVLVSLDTVFRLAQNQNGPVQLARLKVDEAFSEQELSRRYWVPDLSVGMGNWRHEGGIQDFHGNLIKSSYGGAFAGLELHGKYDWKEVLFRRVEAERRYWQQKGELSKLSSENLLDASSTYIDLLAARTGVACSQDTEVRLNELLKQASALAKIDPGVNVEVSRIHAELAAQNVLTVKLRSASKAAAAKLAYLLGLDPCCDLLTADRLGPITLIDVSLPVQTFVDKVLNHGPGVQELEGLLRTVEAARNSNYGWQHWVPSIELSMQEGAFAAGPGSQLDWANRFDMEVHLRWNLNEFLYAKQKRRQADMHIQQVQMSFQDVRLKLTLGVQEARDAALGGMEQMKLAESHILFAEESYKLSDVRLKQNIKGRSPSEVLLALRSLGGARLEYLQAVRDLDKAQLRLYALVGSAEAPTQDGK